MSDSRTLPDLPNRKDRTNWLERAGGLPSYIERIAKHLRSERGFSTSHAIATAVNTVKRWCGSGQTAEGSAGGVSAKTRALACRAVAQWEAKKAASGINASQTKERMVTYEGVMLAQTDVDFIKQITADPFEGLDLSVYESALDLARRVRKDGAVIGRGSNQHTAITGLQNRLSALGYDVENDGLFGPDTERAVKQFQRDNRLRVDGLVGQHTYRALTEDRRRQDRFDNPADIGIDAVGRVVEQEGVGGGPTQAMRSRPGFKGTLFNRRRASNAPAAPETRSSAAGPRWNTRTGEQASREHPIGQTDPNKAPGALRDPYAPGAVSDASFEQLHPRAYDGRFVSKGSSGEQVRGVQQALNSSNGRVRLRVDGDLGSKTDRALRAFQRSHGLKPDGIVGPRTGNALVQSRNTSRVVRRLGIRPPKY